MQLFEDWERLLSTAISSGVFFVLIVVLVRLAGKRITSQMTNFDWIVTVAIGSLASSGILLENVPMSDAIAAIVVLAAMQWLTTYLTVKSDGFAKVVRPAPRLLTHKGEYLEDAMLKERVTKEEIDAALRAEGHMSVEGANWVILEPNGVLTVIPRQDRNLKDGDLLADVVAPHRLDRS